MTLPSLAAGKAPTLVTFAVPEEARPFRRHRLPDTEILVTGMGPRHARAQVERRLQIRRYHQVLTCGFAGALNPELGLGTVVFDSDANSPLGRSLLQAGARAGRIHTTEQVVGTAVGKRELHRATGADVVEMESGVIRALCQAQGIPSATVRVVSDLATEDLPLDFNLLTGADGQVRLIALLGNILRSPRCLPALMRLGRQTSRAARELARVLAHCLTQENGGIHPT